MDGNQMHPNDPKYGVTCWCPASYPEACPAQEVMGHGSNAKDAYAVVLAKYKKGTDEKPIKRNGVGIAKGTAEAGEGGKGAEGET